MASPRSPRPLDLPFSISFLSSEVRERIIPGIQDIKRLREGYEITFPWMAGALSYNTWVYTYKHTYEPHQKYPRVWKHFIIYYAFVCAYIYVLYIKHKYV